MARATAGSTKAEDILAREIANLQSKIKRDQEAQFNYAKNKNLPLTTDPKTNLEVTRLATLSSQLLDAENETKEFKAKYEAARSQPDSFSIPDVQASKRIDMLRERISMLIEKRDALLVIYTPEWPEVRKLEAQIKPIEDELAKAPTEIVNSMKRRYEAAASKEQSLRRAYDQQKGKTTQQTRDQIDLLAITQDLETNKQYLNTLLQRQREISVGQGVQQNDVTISTPSRLPKTPIGPPRLRNIIIAFLLALAAGIGLAFLLDFLDDTVKSIEDVDRYLHIPALALIPASKERPCSSDWNSGPAINGSVRNDGARNDRRCAITDRGIVPALAHVSVALVGGATTEDDPGYFQPTFGRQNNYGNQYRLHAGANRRRSFDCRLRSAPAAIACAL